MTAPSGLKRSRRAQYTARRLRHAVPGRTAIARLRDATRSGRRRKETCVATLIGARKVKSGTLVGAPLHAADIHEVAGVMARGATSPSPWFRCRMWPCQACRSWRRAVSGDHRRLMIQRSDDRGAKHRNKDQREYQHRCKGHCLWPARIFFHGMHSL
jgi:hypothetical protein